MTPYHQQSQKKNRGWTLKLKKGVVLDCKIWREASVHQLYGGKRLLSNKLLLARDGKPIESGYL